MLKYAPLTSTRCGAWSMSLFGCKDDISRVSCCVCPAGKATSSLTHGIGAGGTRSRTRGLLSPTLPLALLLPSHPMPTGSPLAPVLGQERSHCLGCSHGAAAVGLAGAKAVCCQET